MATIRSILISAGGTGVLLIGTILNPAFGAEPIKEPRLLQSAGSTAAGAIVSAQVSGPPAPQAPQPTPKPYAPSLGSTSVEDLLLEKGSITMDDWIRIKAEEEYRVADRDKRSDLLEEWKTKVEKLPLLTDKVNVGLNALQWLYAHQDAHVGEGKSQDNISIRRSEFIFWG